jgi:hypothetical protein
MKVWPRTEAIRKVLNHPSAGAFRPEGPADWPKDTFTVRRIRDGDLLTSSPEQQKSKTTRDVSPASSPDQPSKKAKE